MEHLKINTRALKINDHMYCAYCGKKMEFDEVWDPDTCKSDWYYRCDCPDAKKEIEIKKKIESLEREIVFLKRDIPDAFYEAGPVPIKK